MSIDKESLDLLANKFLNIEKEIKKVIVGQKEFVRGLLLSLLCNGHILIEGLPGLAKTSTVKVFSDMIGTDFKRVQFTPDLLPSDLIGTAIYDSDKKDFSVKKGPVFTNFLLSDEINRSPAKVQAALLEAMQERQVTIYKDTFNLPEIFVVMATQNPIEQEGTYVLPEAQLDRFMLKINVVYPSKTEELEILNIIDKDIHYEKNILAEEDVFRARNLVKSVYIDEKIKKYIIDLVDATRNPTELKLDIAHLIHYGASPRASIYLLTCAKANAFLNKRDYVTPEDIKDIVYYILNHRISLSYEAIAEKISTNFIISNILAKVSVP